jgi:hypothetical protein
MRPALPWHRANGSYLTDIVTLDGHDAVYRLIKLDLAAGSVAVGIHDDTPSTFGQHPALAGMRVPERYDA